MKLLLILISICLLFALLVPLTAYICFRMAFYAPRKAPAVPKEYDVPEGEVYEPYHAQMIDWIKQTRALPYEKMAITSFDGLTLYGKYYECRPGAPIELMFHGYRGNAERDLGGGVQRCFRLGRNVLLVDQRTSGDSQGNIISFGINESKDCLRWIDALIERFGKDVKIILTGISMGAATVMTAAGKELPDNVVAILADCGYSSAKDIIKKCIRDMKLPADLLYPFVKLGAKWFGHFDLEEASPITAMKNCKKPIIFVHGEDDTFVPCEMSRQCYEACTSPKVLLTVPGAGHGLGYVVGMKAYFDTLLTFSNENGIVTELNETQNLIF